MNIPNSEANTANMPDEEKIGKIKAVEALRREEHGVRGLARPLASPRQRTMTGLRSSLDEQGT